MTRLYEDEDFQREKVMLEEQIVKASTATAESKSFIREMDDFLKDLQSWKTKRDVQHADPSIPQEESKAAQDEDNRFLLKLEDEFMKKADER